MLGNESIIVGARVELLWFDGSIVHGIIKYVGPLVNMPGDWVGLQLDQPSKSSLTPLLIIAIAKIV